MSTTVERRYRMTRLDSGDYLLPANDLSTLWRISRYDDDGRKVWGLWQWDGGFPTDDSLLAALETEDWTRWEFWSGPLSSRSEAVEEALKVAATTLEP